MSFIDDKKLSLLSSINDKMIIFAPGAVKLLGSMTKDLIKLLIAEYQAYVTQVELVRRDVELMDDQNYVFVGLRHAGKSYLMYQRIAQLLVQGHKREEILYFNFEDDRIDSLDVTDLDLIKTCYEEMYDSRPIFFLDEVQLVDRWEKFARRLADQKYQVYITGSNAKMLSSEIATTLGGRYMVHEVYPYSFAEYLKASGIGYMADTWLILPYENLFGKLQDKESNRKYYFTDNGLLHLFLVDADTSLLENIVAITLRRKYGDGSYFWNSRNAEVDFVIPEKELAIQVSYSMADPDTFKRETDGLIKLSSVQNVKRMIVVTKDEEDIVEKDDCRIEIIPLWKWLLEY